MSSKANVLVGVGIVALVGAVALVTTSPSQSTTPHHTDAGLRSSSTKFGPSSELFTPGEYETMFHTFVLAYDKEYAKSNDVNEMAKRFKIFKENVDFVHRYNQEVSSHSLAINQFADLTKQEFAALYVGLKRSNSDACILKRENDTDLPSEIDWRQSTKNPAHIGAVTPVKNQAQCGSCWAFSTTGALEGRSAINTGKLESLSEQQLVDCSGDYGNVGCSGGMMDQGFEYVEDHGLCSEVDYAYTGHDGSCHADKCTPVIKPGQVKQCVDVPSSDNDALKAAVATGPVSVAIEADQSVFQFYQSGILDGSCGTSLDHGVLIVGYGSQGGVDYWIVKNSWGSSWGEMGYVRIKRDAGQGSGLCGIALDASYPVLA